VERDKMLLSEDLKRLRAERPDEWEMDEFIRKAKQLEEQNSNIRADTLKVMIKEFSLKDGYAKLELETGLTRIFANYVKEMMEEMGAENFITSTFTFQGEDEPYYMTMGRCNGKTISEKYLEVCEENRKLKEGK